MANVIVWGTKKEAVSFAYGLEGKGEDMVSFFIDSNKKENEFMGKPVKYPSEVDFTNNDYYIWIATGQEAYYSIKNYLDERGLSEIEDYAHISYALGKKLVLLHGNCHMDMISRYLQTSEMFINEYTIYPLAAIHNNTSRQISHKLLEICDVFMHQDIRKENPYGIGLSDEYTLSVLKDDCVRITVPNLYGMGRAFFPQADMNRNNYTTVSFRYGYFPHLDKVIDEEIECGKSCAQIYDRIMSFPFSKSEIKEGFDYYMSKLHRRQSNWDIDAESYIWDNYKVKQLFYDIEHPSSDVLRFFSDRLLGILGIYDSVAEINVALDAYENPVYPCVTEALGLQWTKEYIRTKSYAYKMNAYMDIKEYVKEYIYWRGFAE